MQKEEKNRINGNRKKRLNYWLTVVVVVIIVTVSFGKREMDNSEMLGFGRAFLFGIFLVFTYSIKSLIDSKNTSIWIQTLTTYFWVLFVFIVVFISLGISGENFSSTLLGAAVFALIITPVIMFLPLLARNMGFTRK